MARGVRKMRTQLKKGHMPSRNVGKKRLVGKDSEVPAELAKREAQDRPAGRSGVGRAESPVDSMHVDAPKKQDNARGHRHRDALK
jgi:hypothetical protein